MIVHVTHGICAVRMAADMTLLPQTTSEIREACPSPSSFILQDVDTGIVTIVYYLLNNFFCTLISRMVPDN